MGNMGCLCDEVKVQGEEEKKDNRVENLEEEDKEEEDEKERNKKDDKSIIKRPNKIKEIKKSTKRKKKNNIQNEETIPDNKNEFEDTILEIEKEKKEIYNILNEKNKMTKEKEEEIELKSLSQYYINPKKEKVDLSFSNQIIVSFKEKINPFTDNINEREDIKKIKNKVNEIKRKYSNNKQITIKPISDKLGIDLNQKIWKNYELSFTYKNLENDKDETFSLQEIKKPTLFVIFDIKTQETIQKIKEIKKYKDKVNKDKDTEKHFDLILFVKENDKYIKEKINRHELGVCYLCATNEPNFKKFFGNYEELDSKCIFLNKMMEISLILENDIEFLKEETIEYYLERDSVQKEKKLFDCFKKDDINLLKDNCENDDFKDCLGKMKEKYNITIEFREIGDKKYPVNVRFEYHQDDEETAKDIIRKLENYIKNLEIKKKFIVKKPKKSDNQKNDEYNKIENELIESNSNVARLKKKLDNEIEEKETYKSELNKERKEKEKYKNELNIEKSKINIKIRTNDEIVIYSNRWNKTDKIAIIKKDFLNQYPTYKNYNFEYKVKILDEAKDLDYYNIQDNDDIFVVEKE